MKPPASRPVSLGFGITPLKERHENDASQPAAAKRKAKVLVVDHDPGVRRILTARLGAAGYVVSTVDAAQTALDACVRSRPSVVISELRLGDMDGLALLRELKSRWPQVSVIILTTHASIPEAVQATQAGAFSFLVKPVGRQELLGHVERATAASNPPQIPGDWRDQVVSRSKLMEDRLALANRAAASTVPLLLTGASAAGKELLARAIHAASARRDKPFATTVCRASSDKESQIELFGEAGRREAGGRAGAFQRAAQGTLLIEEVGALSPHLQSLLAQVLRMPPQSAGPSRLQAAANAGVRLILTTSRDLAALAEQGQFSRELLDLIGLLPFETPPLGRRREDLPLLISYFLEQAVEPGGQTRLYTPDAIERLATNDWPPNVRRLFDLVKQNLALSHGDVEEFLQHPVSEEDAKFPTYDEAREAFARAYLADNLQRTGGNVTQAARIAKRTRTDFYKLLARYRLDPDDFKPAPRTRRGK